MTESVTADLHAGFRRPERGDAAALGGFLHAVDQLPGIRRIHEAMRSAMAPRDGERLVDAGCGLGIETRRLAEQHPGSTWWAWTATTLSFARPCVRGSWTPPVSRSGWTSRPR